MSSRSRARRVAQLLRAGRPPTTWRDLLAPLVLFAIILGIWYFVSLVVLDPDRRFLLPSPDSVVRVAFLDLDNLEQLLRGLWLSTKVALIGLGVSIVLGMAIAIAMSQARWVEKSVYPYAVVLQTIPTLAMVPLIGFWFDYGFFSRVVVCVLIALFPVISSTLFGLQSVDQGMLDLFRMHRISRWRRLVSLQLPAAMPATFAGFQVSAGLSVVGAVVGDFFFKQGDPGIGVLIDLYRARLLSQQLFGAVILASLLGVVVFVFFGWLSRLVTGRWYGAETP
ncbi:ABC transporter permease [Frankia sp. R82]|uniref:ABC transporter permease n=1 Tax=Frankia sp. R82 TaxID=2950553 RepID=UPI0020431980|nr:ABC transporter permease [Frankia sp. R82]MCM3886712.1 ABC transporter permease [Frankia sp. R82]